MTHPREPGAPPRRFNKRNEPSTFEGATVPDGLFKASKPHISITVEPVSPYLRRLGSKTPWFWIIERKEEKPRQVKAPAYHSRMLNWLQIVTTPTADTAGTCLVLHYDDKRYLFGNISEGTQRALVQRKITMQKIEDVFISGPTNYHNAGGLFGMVLTLADIIAGQRQQLKEKNRAQKEKGKAAVPDNVLPGLNIHGGKNLAHYLATARRFIFRNALPLQPHEIRTDPRSLGGHNEPDWSDSNINVWYVPLEPKTAEEPSEPSRKRSHDSELEPENPGTTDADTFQATLNVVEQMFNSNWKIDALCEFFLHDVQQPAKLWVRGDNGHIKPYDGPLGKDAPNIRVLARTPWPASQIQTLPYTKPARQSVCYIVKNHDRRGKFNPQLAAKYDIPRTEYKTLTMGKSVTAKDGTVVTPDMVLGADVAGKGFALLDVPDESYVETLINRPEWAYGDLMKNIAVMYWILGPNVAQDTRVLRFMEKHGAIRHIVCSGDTAPNMITLESVATQAYKLHNIDPDRFPIPYHTNDASLTGLKLDGRSELYERGRTGKKVQFSPQYLHQDDALVQYPNLKTLAEGEPNLDEVAALAATARKKIQDATFSAKIEEAEADIPSRDAEVVTLGTGSALPSKYRNVSATLVRVPGYGNYLFDAGENTMGQLRRVFGQELPDVLRNLKVIWISHLHADHHLGTASVIRAWNEETSRSDPSASLHVASHTHMIDWLREYSQVEDYGFGRLTFTQFGVWDSENKMAPKMFSEHGQKAYGLKRIDACRVDHCHGALATVFTWPTGLKIAYSGDCRPSQAFVEIGQGTTLLIHESTFDSTMTGDAMAKKHSTMDEAIDVGRKMGARRILLTHFSQRYQKVPLFEGSFDIKTDVKATGKQKARLDEVILMSFDYMRVKLGDFRRAQAFLPAIQKLLEDVADQENETGA